MWELNTRYPMWQATGLLKTYDKNYDGTKTTNTLNVLEYAQAQSAKWSSSDKCTKSELTADLPKDVFSCASDTVCASNP